MAFHWILRDIETPQVSKTLLNIQANFCSNLDEIISILPLLSCSSNLFSRFFLNIQREPTMIGITVTFMFHSFFRRLAESWYFSSFSSSVTFTR